MLSTYSLRVVNNYTCTTACTLPLLHISYDAFFCLVSQVLLNRTLYSADTEDLGRGTWDLWTRIN